MDESGSISIDDVRLDRNTRRDTRKLQSTSNHTFPDKLPTQDRSLRLPNFHRLNWLWRHHGIDFFISIPYDRLPSKFGMRQRNRRDGSKLNPKERIAVVDALRGLAALAVVFFHFGLRVDWTNWGHMGVPVFFVLSGYVIAMSIGSQRASNELPAGRRAICLRDEHGSGDVLAHARGLAGEHVYEGGPRAGCT